jgi:hypothetical protein
MLIQSEHTDLEFQWYKDGKPITGQVSSVLHLESAEITDSGNYYLLVSRCDQVGLISYFCQMISPTVSIVIRESEPGTTPSPSASPIPEPESTPNPIATPIPMPPPVIIPPPGGPEHAYFDGLVRRPETLYAYSLRNQAQLDIEVRGSSSSSKITYDYAADTYAKKQDGAKVTIKENRTSSQQSRLPIDVDRGDIIITWDVWYGKEWEYKSVPDGEVKTHVVAQKTFQVASSRGRAQRWLEIPTRFAKAEGQGVGLIEGRTYGPIGPNATDNHPLNPMMADFIIAPETWSVCGWLTKPEGRFNYLINFNLTARRPLQNSG